MSSNKTIERQAGYNYFLRVLAFLAEQKISTAKQIDKYCFFDASHSLVWKVLKQLGRAKLIETNVIKRDNSRRFFSFSLTKNGLQELKNQGQLDLEDFQLKSNTPIHDIILTDLRLFFSKLTDCELFIPENIIRSKILEEELAELSIFRSHRSDSAVVMNMNGDRNWLALEYERNQKSFSRYENKIKNWYQSENLFGVLLIAENDALIQQMSKIETKILPHLPRKILYSSLSCIDSSNSEIKFFNCQSKSLTFKLGNSLKINHPILNQNFANLRTKK